ncbi:hypothetical protein GW17_00014838 [Ensete ventricosum]|nr:hypothetical protein GW17_00014838 [Ensete ventricosum]
MSIRTSTTRRKSGEASMLMSEEEDEGDEALASASRRFASMSASEEEHEVGEATTIMSHLNPRTSLLTSEKICSFGPWANAWYPGSAAVASDTGFTYEVMQWVGHYWEILLCCHMDAS